MGVIYAWNVWMHFRVLLIEVFMQAALFCVTRLYVILSEKSEQVSEVASVPGLPRLRTHE